jgi:hypothetical protein
MRFFDLAVPIALTACMVACELDERGIVPSGSPEGGSKDAARLLDGRVPDAPRQDAPGSDTSFPDAPAATDGQGGLCPTPPDCSNPACVSDGYVCTPAAPDSGWSIVAVDFTGADACPSGFGTSYAVVSAPTGGPASCGCVCSVGSSPSCVVGKIDIEITNGGSAICNNPVTWDAADGDCTATSATFAASVKVTGTPAASGGSCSGSPTTTLPPSGSTTSYVCPLTGAPSTTGCSGGQVCIAKSSAMSQCVAQSGSVACAGAYTVSHDVGTSVTDGRTCTGECACGGPAGSCSAESWTFYSNNDCTGTAYPVNLDGSCDPTGFSGTSAFSYRYLATPTGTTCGAPTSTPTPSGSLSLAGAEQICCLP